MQHTYWKKLTQYKFSLYYLETHLAKCIKIDRSFKIALAIASATSIVAWTNWQNLAFFWGLVIACSQIATAINDFLPYKRRIKEISNLRAELSVLYNDIESDWYKVSSGQLNENEINKLCYNYARKWNEIDNRYFVDDVLPQNEKYINIAENQKNSYFETNF